LHQEIGRRGALAERAKRSYGTWTTKDCCGIKTVYVPNDAITRKGLLSAYCDNVTKGHVRVTKIVKLISRYCFWKSLIKNVKSYIGNCAICQRTKARTHRHYGLLGALLAAIRSFKEISMDFITGLPGSISAGSNKRCDALLVVVDRFIKYALFVPMIKTLTSSALADLLLARVFSEKGLPKGIISDRGSIFISHFWKEFCYHLAVKRRLSTAWHLQTDGQTERINQIIEQYLRFYCEIT
jgi:hypothetical protein